MVKAMDRNGEYSSFANEREMNSGKRPKLNCGDQTQHSKASLECFV